jgi:2-polyprenyl-6-methoxyphenol hydroxylase-like FAD-dependent oxidoreductase
MENIAMSEAVYDATVDVAIIGAGPSGAVAAALLRKRGRSVLVLERQHFPRFSIGESLLPQSMAYLEEAGMLQAVVEAGFQFKNGAHFVRRGESSAYDFRDKHSEGWGTTYQVERAAFDQILIGCAAKAGADVRFGHTVRAMKTGDTPELDVADEAGNAYRVNARFVLDASGFGRVLPRLLNLEAPTRMPVRSALFTHVLDRIPAGATDRDKIVIGVHPERSDVWFWMIPLARGRTSVGCVAQSAFLDVPEGERDATLRELIRSEPTIGALARPRLCAARQRGRVSRSGVFIRRDDRAALRAPRGSGARIPPERRHRRLDERLRQAAAPRHRHVSRVRRTVVYRRIAGHHLPQGTERLDSADDQRGAGGLCVGRDQPVCRPAGAASRRAPSGLRRDGGEMTRGPGVAAVRPVRRWLVIFAARPNAFDPGLR